MKKRRVLLVLLIALCLSITVFLTACDSDAIKSISLDAGNATSLFDLNSEFSAEDLIVLGERTDGKHTRIKLSDCEVSQPDMSTVGEKTITVTYGGMTATYKINVIVFQEIAKFTGRLAGTLYGYPVSQNVVLSCINNGTYELRYANQDSIRDTGKYVETGGVYTFTLAANNNEVVSSVTFETGVVTVVYTGNDMPVTLSIYNDVTRLSGTLILQVT